MASQPNTLTKNLLSSSGALRLSDVKDPLRRREAERILTVIAGREAQIGENEVLILQQLVIQEFIRS